ncbi:MAG: hypothetical protein WAZ98_09340 [Cyclobacteriaceae bacterium]
MRLGQLARKLSLRPSQIVDFLAQQNIQIEDGSNTRMDEGHVELVVRHYAPEILEQIVQEADEPEITTANATASVVEESNTVVDEVEKSDLPVGEGEPEVIRVQKVELSGLKVLGKIDLPEPKKKEPATAQQPESQSSDAGTKPLHSKKKTDRRGKERSYQRPSRNPIEVQREREAREAEAKRQATIANEKEKRKKHYEERRKAAFQPKRVKPVKEQPEARTSFDKRPVPTTWFGKFLRWWTT